MSGQPESNSQGRNKIKFELDLSNYAIKSNVKDVTDVENLNSIKFY